MANRMQAIVLVVALAFAAMGSAGQAQPPTEARAPDPTAAELMDDLMWGRGVVGGPFELTDHHGRRRTYAEFRGSVMVVYFGYMFCPDVCPTDLQVIAQAIDDLGAAGAAVQPLFVTVDPERDTVERLAQYVRSFHVRLIGLTGTVEEIRRVARAYKAWFARVDDPRATSYLMEHSSYVYLIDADGLFAGFLPPGTPHERMRSAIEAVLSGKRG